MTASIPVAGLITAGSFPVDRPIDGLADTLELFEEAEALGFDTFGVRQRHLERGVSSALTVLAAATQRTDRIVLETNVVPLGFETPFRLAEDFATVGALSRGRLHVGISSSAPHGGVLAGLNRPDARSDTDPYELIVRFLCALEGHRIGDGPLQTPYGPEPEPRVQPHLPGLRDQVWIGGGSDRSVDWAAREGLHLFLGNLTDADGDAGFEESQRRRVERYRAGLGPGVSGRVAVERVLLPTDSADAEQRAHYATYAASREARTREPQGERRTVIARDLHGTAEQIAQALAEDPVFDGGTELRVSLPYGFAQEEYLQILRDVREHVLPGLGWRPSA